MNCEAEIDVLGNIRYVFHQPFNKCSLKFLEICQGCCWYGNFFLYLNTVHRVLNKPSHDGGMHCNLEF